MLTLARTIMPSSKVADKKLVELTLPGRDYFDKTKTCISKANLTETENYVHYWRNGRFGLLSIYFDKKDGVLKFVVKTCGASSKTIAWLRIEKERILTWRANKGFRSGMDSRLFFKEQVYSTLLGKLKDGGMDEFQTIYRQVEKYFLDLFLNFHHYKSLSNIYFKFYNHEEQLDLFNCCTSSYFYRKFRKCRGIHDVTKLIFGKNAKEYREFLLTLKDYPSFVQCYYHIKYFKLTPEEVIKKHCEWPATIYRPEKYKTLVKVFGVKKIKDYLVKKTGWISSVNDILQMRLRYSDSVNDYIDRFDFDIRTLHDVYVYLGNKTHIKRNLKLPNYEKLNQLPEHKEFVYDFADCSLDLVQWGQELKICIGSYDDRMISGENYCFSIIDENNNRYCFEYSKCRIIQAKGYRNSAAPKKLVKIVEKDFEQLRLTLKSMAAIEMSNVEQEDDIVKVSQLAQKWLRAKR